MIRITFKDARKGVRELDVTDAKPRGMGAVQSVEGDESRRRVRFGLSFPGREIARLRRFDYTYNCEGWVAGYSTSGKLKNVEYVGL